MREKFDSPSGPWRSVPQAILLTTVSALLILLAPPPLATQRSLICADIQSIGHRAHIVVNCDADAFVKLARDPSGVFEYNSPRQTRPGYLVLGWISALPFRAIALLSHGLDPFYAGYVAINWVLMILSVVLLADLISARSLLSPGAIVPMTVLLINHVTKAFFWTPHQQVFSLFVSMLSIWLGRWVLNRRDPISRKISLLAGFSLGIACLIYGAFILVPATLTVAAWIFGRRARSSRDLIPTAILWTGAIIPFTLWRAYVLKRTGNFYSHETQYYHEFVWIVEQWKASPASLGIALRENVTRFIATVPLALGLPIAFLAAALVLAITRSRALVAGSLSSTAVPGACAFLVAAIPFYGLMGFYDPRLTTALVPAFLVIVGSATREAFSSGTSHNLLPEPTTIAAIGYAAIVILIRGPYA